jgi:multiple sugar transport system substrate-binding protein
MTAWFNAAWNDVSNKAIGDPFVEWGKKNNVEFEYEVLAAQQMPKITAALQAGNPPEIMEANPSIAYWEKLGEVMDVSPIYNRIKDKSGGMFPIVQKAITSLDGKQYGLAFEVYPWPAHARRDSWEKVGGFPKTWDEFTEKAPQVQQPPRTFAFGLATGREADHYDNFVAIMWAYGAQLMNDKGEPTFKSPGTVQALQLVKKHWDLKTIPEDSLAATVTSWNNENYQKKRILSAINPPTIYGNLVVNDKELLDLTGLYPLPAGPAGSFTEVTLKNWVIYKKAKNADRAMEALEYVMQPEQIQKIVDSAAGRSVPPYKGLTDTEFWKKDPYSSLVKIVGETGRPRYHPFGESAWGAAVIDSNIMSDMFTRVVQQNEDPDKAVDWAHAEIVKIYEKFK